MRFHVKPRCVPPQVAARRLGLTYAQFQEAIGMMRESGFPLPDPVTGHYDLEAIDRYIERRNPELFGTPEEDGVVTDNNVFLQRIAAMGRG